MPATPEIANPEKQETSDRLVLEATKITLDLINLTKAARPNDINPNTTPEQCAVRVRLVHIDLVVNHDDQVETPSDPAKDGLFLDLVYPRVYSGFAVDEKGVKTFKLTPSLEGYDTDLVDIDMESRVNILATTTRAQREALEEIRARKVAVMAKAQAGLTRRELAERTLVGVGGFVAGGALVGALSRLTRGIGGNAVNAEADAQALLDARYRYVMDTVLAENQFEDVSLGTIRVERGTACFAFPSTPADDPNGQNAVYTFDKPITVVNPLVVGNYTPDSEEPVSEFIMVATDEGPLFVMTRQAGNGGRLNSGFLFKEADGGFTVADRVADVISGDKALIVDAGGPSTTSRANGSLESFSVQPSGLVPNSSSTLNEYDPAQPLHLQNPAVIRGLFEDSTAIHISADPRTLQ